MYTAADSEVWFDEYDLVARDEVQRRLFANHNLAPDDIVAM